jgi:hypothetical protein
MIGLDSTSVAWLPIIFYLPPAMPLRPGHH